MSRRARNRPDKRAVFAPNPVVHDCGEDDFDPYEEPPCDRCHGDGRDPWNDYLLPCPECQGEQRPNT